MSEVSVVLMTAPDVATAEKVARALVDEKLAACVNLVPGIRSIYAWEGSIHDDAEVLMIAKTTATSVAALSARVKSLHPYEVPEVVAVNATGGFEKYLEWVSRQTTR